jgi:hypothetical protein
LLLLQRPDGALGLLRRGQEHLVQFPARVGVEPLEGDLLEPGALPLDLLVKDGNAGLLLPGYLVMLRPGGR